jgi:hypothetical protein
MEVRRLVLIVAAVGVCLWAHNRDVFVPREGPWRSDRSVQYPDAHTFGGFE